MSKNELEGTAYGILFEKIVKQQHDIERLTKHRNDQLKINAVVLLLLNKITKVLGG